ncbi:hypothetical protein D9756_010639 [Leucocoprinus leucothites]|uniref:Uncharacterized protein n=1 Tax=Leucocoprinus leucothites TaxID=201217 RepID=A0A8H5CTG9_9AGAR|nr:hypothetical protein D9756_010639 [Leucoagaricus leucothites]
MSGSFTNASNFVISNSSFTHVSGNQHNYNFSGRPSASSYDAMARFVIAVDSSKSTTDNSSSSQKSEIYIHALRKSTDPTVACQTQSSTTSPHVQSARLSFEGPRADPHFAQPSFIRNPVAPPSPAQFPHAKTSPPSGASQSSRDGFVHQETSAGIDRLSNAETWFSSGDRISSPSSGPDTEAIPSHSSTSDVGGSSSLAPLPAPTVVGPRAPCQPLTTRQYNCPNTAGAVRLPQARFPALPKHHVPPQNSYEIQTPSASPNLMPRPSYDVYRRQMNDDTPYPAWFEESRMVQSPLPSKNQHLESRHLSHPATPRRAYHSYPRPTLILKVLILTYNYTESRICSGGNPRLGAIIMMTAQISNPGIVLP